MRIVNRLANIFKSMRRRILVTVSVVYLVSSGVSAIWIFYEVSHEVDELFDAEMVQQAKTLAFFLPQQLTSNERNRQQTIQSVSKHEYEDKLAYRIERANSDWSLRTEGAPSAEELPFKTGFSELTIAGKLWHSYGLVSRDEGYHVILLQEDSFRSELRSDLTIDTLIPVLFLLPLMLWFGWWSINRSFLSFQRLANQLRKRHTSDYRPFSQERDDEEVVLVKQALNQYLARIEQTVKREKRFSADAAHELRTPLAALKARLQALMSSSAPLEVSQLEPLLISTERLVTLVESLLMLSKAELPSEQNRDLNIAKIIRQVVADKFEQAEQRSLDFQIDLPERLGHFGNDSYWYTLLANLIDNAIKYAAPQTSIKIGIESNALVIGNIIAANQTLETARLAERFYRGKHLDVEGSGLGLSIVQNLAQQLQIEIEFLQQDTYFICRLSWGEMS